MNADTVAENPSARKIFDKIRKDENVKGAVVPLEDVKIQVNTLLWELLPAKTTLGRAEEIALAVFDLIWNEREIERTRKEGSDGLS